MTPPTFLCAALLCTGSLALPARADGLEPASALVFPVHRTSFAPVAFTAVAVTNLNLVPATPVNGLGGSTNLHYEFVNVVPNPSQPNLPLDCVVADKVELLTPADTRVALATCDNGGGVSEGYLVVTALDPNAFATPWSHNYLVGSELVVSKVGGLWYQNAIPFKALAAKGAPTDVDGDGELDFDGVEYEGVPDELFLDAFLGDIGSSLVLINLSGGNAFTANVRFDIFNDNEQALSATYAFRCWSERALVGISLVFDANFLAHNTNQDPTELDIDCRVPSTGEVEVGWARIRGVNHASSVETCPDAALLGALGQGSALRIGARRLWESKARQFDGDFLKTGTDDPECGSLP